VIVSLPARVDKVIAAIAVIGRAGAAAVSVSLPPAVGLTALAVDPATHTFTICDVLLSVAGIDRDVVDSGPTVFTNDSRCDVLSKEKPVGRLPADQVQRGLRS